MIPKSVSNKVLKDIINMVYEFKSEMIKYRLYKKAVILRDIEKELFRELIARGVKHIEKRMINQDITNKTLRDMMDMAFDVQSNLANAGLPDQAVKVREIELEFFMEIRQREQKAKLEQDVKDEMKKRILGWEK